MQWIQVDPLGYVDGMKDRGFVENNPARKTDSFGLISRDNLLTGRVSYSCNCGYIDWEHGNPYIALGLLQNMLGGDYFKIGKLNYKMVTYSQTMGNVVSTGETRSYLVRTQLSQVQRESAALAIFLDVSYAFEAAQVQWGALAHNSGFSEEDLISDLIGFYMAARGYSRPAIESMCHVLSQTDSLWVYDNSGAGTNKTLNPVFHSCPFCKTSSFPKELQVIKPAKIGDRTKPGDAGSSVFHYDPLEMVE